MSGHSLERTSPKGPGQKFVGCCILCGKTDLTMADLGEECPNPSGEDPLLAALGLNANEEADQ